MTPARALLFLSLSASWVAGCVTTPPQAESAPSARNTLTRTELATSNSSNLFDAISKLRPEWLSSRGPTSLTDATPASVSVFMDGSMLGKAESLKQLGVLDVTEVRYWDAAQASARFGMGHPRGVLELLRR